MTGCIFISYRRDDASSAAGRIYDRLKAKFGADQIFFDVDSIDYGLDFVEILSTHVSECDALVAIVGQKWATVRDESGNRRLDLDTDFVRIEITAALKRDVRVIPVLVDGAKMPKADELPKDMEMFARRNCIEIAHTRFDLDADRLVRALNRAIEAVKAEKLAEKERSDEQEKRVAEEKRRKKAKRLAQAKRRKAMAEDGVGIEQKLIEDITTAALRSHEKSSESSRIAGKEWKGVEEENNEAVTKSSADPSGNEDARSEVEATSPPNLNKWKKYIILFALLFGLLFVVSYIKWRSAAVPELKIQDAPASASSTREEGLDRKSLKLEPEAARPLIEEGPDRKSLKLKPEAARPKLIDGSQRILPAPFTDWQARPPMPNEKLK